MSRDVRQDRQDRDPLFDALVAVLLTLGPYLNDLTLIGGWVPYLYQRFGDLAAWHTPRTLTIEADMLAPEELLPRGRPPIAAALRAAGLSPSATSLPAARWVAPPPRGEQLEFLAVHRGPARRIGEVRQIVGQEDIAAVRLPRLAVLGRHTTTLRVSASAPGSHDVPRGLGDATRQRLPDLSVTVPQLGVYTLQKAATFADRLNAAGTRSRERAAKDLLYVRDIGAGGSAVGARVVKDLERAVATDSEIAGLIADARANIEGTLRGALRSLLEDVARMRVVREPQVSLDEARADVDGHLIDLLDRLGGMSRE